MNTVYVVKRKFKTNGVEYALGSIILDPNDIRLLKTKIRDGKLIEVKENDLSRIAEYVKSRTGVDPYELFKKEVIEKPAVKPIVVIEKPIKKVTKVTKGR